MRRNTSPGNWQNSVLGGVLVVAAISLAACTEAPAPFNTVEKFRLLSLAAEPPSLEEGETTEVSGLFYSPDDDLDNISYKWSWCPIAVNPSDSAACIITEEMFVDIAEQMALQNADALPEGIDVSGVLEALPLSFDLGSDPTARFPYAVPADLLRQVCESILSEDIPSGIGVPDCRVKLNVVIRLEATLGEETRIAYKTVPLYIEAEYADNENPEIDGLALFDEAGDPVDMASEMPVLYRGETYSLEADIDETASQWFTPAPSASDPEPESLREYLFMTWYSEGGESEYARTTFIHEEVPMEVLRGNTWTIPRAVDFPDDEISLYLVLQDERGGAGWLDRRFTVRER